MVMVLRAGLVGCVLGLLCSPLTAQAPPIPAPAPTPAMEPPPAKDAVAARVDGQVIPELAIYRRLLNVPPDRREAARKDHLNFLIDNAVVDQYLLALKIGVTEKEIDEQINKMKAEAAKEKQDFPELLKKLIITEAELRAELTYVLRWDKFVLQQGTDPKLRDLFDKNVEMFNGSRMHARHILVPIEGGKKDAAQAKTLAIKKQIESEVAQALANVPPTADAITREKERARVLNKTFAETAMKESSCPSKKEGGDIGSFRRVGEMVEPFARTAFALKPYQLSDPIPTEFGYHLILAIDYQPGKEVTFDKARPFVQEVYGERLREAILTHYKGQKKIEIVERKK